MVYPPYPQLNINQICLIWEMVHHLGMLTLVVVSCMLSLGVWKEEGQKGYLSCQEQRC